MRSFFLSLIVVLFTTAVAVNTAHARKIYRHHKSAAPARISFDTDSIAPDSVIHFAQSLIGVRYRSATSNPLLGFDCSGFVSYVFKSFNLGVPRSSCEFINVGEKIRLQDAKPGDIILFTGTKKHTHKIGHIGIVYSNDGAGNFTFIHSTSGKEHGVTITAMDENYKRRYVQIIRLLKQNDV
jgi:murein DD-endopeptidase / murein LD-carboxypeptidase